MSSSPIRFRLLDPTASSASLGACSALALVILGSIGRAQDPGIGTEQGAGVSREGMWPAPTAEDWKRPVSIAWQRTWDDAVAVSKETGKAILVCTNMDGEIASEHYAGIRYRQPEVAKLFEDYVTVIASVYRHTARDFDEQGERIPCPRFGHVTCGEHIAIEPVVFEKFFDGERVAPRHVMVELDGEEVYDIYYAFDTRSVFRTIYEGVANRPKPDIPPRGDMSLPELVASRAHADRLIVERAYQTGDRAQKLALLQAALAHVQAEPVGVLRLAVFGLDSELAQLARKALVQCSSEDAVELMGKALRVPMPADEREAIVEKLESLASTSQRARLLATAFRGLDSSASSIDVERIATELAATGVERAAPDWSTLDSKLNYQASAAAARPDDPMAKVALAEAAIELALDPETARIVGDDARSGRKFRRLMFQDAREAALAAEALGAKGWAVDATLAAAAHQLGDWEEARKRAEAAVPAMPIEAATTRTAFSVMSVFAHARHNAIARAVRERQDWPRQWLTDAHAAYSVLGTHPLGTALQVSSHFDLLQAFGASGQCDLVLQAGLARFPDSWELHGRLRDRVLAEHGPGALASTYAELMAAQGASPQLGWFAGYAAIVAAEYERRANREDAAMAAYARAIELFDATIAADPGTRASADHYAAMALAGRARVELERGELEAAISDVLASFERRPDAAASRDGLNLSAVDTAKMLRERLAQAERPADVERVDAALAALDPAMLELPEFERGGPPPQRGGTGPRRGR